MCGIFGIFGTQDRPVSVPLENAAASLRLMHHRGPDAQRLTAFSIQSSRAQTFSVREALPPEDDFSGILGSCRLSIIDRKIISDQPMQLDGKNLWIAYNGEIYNYRELRDELKALGYTFSTDSDTEVILALFDYYGGDCLPEMASRLNGMFAFAIWDGQKLYMGRDRYGIKPLYYTYLTPGDFAFASELKNLMALPGCSRSLNPLGLWEHFTFHTTYFDRTLVHGIHLLEPGHCGILDPATAQFDVRKYWEPVFDTKSNSRKGAKTLTKEIREIFEVAVERQLVGEVPIGTFLSGGMDTGAITAVAGRKIPGMNTFTCGFDIAGMDGTEQYFDERDDAKFLVDTFNTQHHEMLVTSVDLQKTMLQTVWHLDDFRMGISYQNYLVNKLVKESVTVVLSGVGGDELFAGYPWRYQPVLGLTDPEDFENRYYESWERILTEDQKHALFSKHVRNTVGNFSTRDSFHQMLASCKAEDPLNKALCFDMKTFLHGLLIVEDRLSMAHSVESRVPFLDNDLVDLCLTLPGNLKLTDDGISKWILKEAFKGLLPDAVLQRRKQGFTPPDMTWFRGPSRNYIEEILLSEKAQDRGIFEPGAVRTLLNEHFEGKANHRFLIWSFLCLEWWLTLFADAGTHLAPPESILPATGVSS